MSYKIPARIPEMVDGRIKKIYLEENKLDPNSDRFKAGVDVADLLMEKAGNANLILDLAGGTGIFGYPLAKKFEDAKIIVIDNDSETIRAGQQAIRDGVLPPLPNLEFVVKDAYNLNEYSNVDTVTIVQGIHHFDHLEYLLLQIKKVLKANGYIFFVELCRDLLQNTPLREAVDTMYGYRKQLGDKYFVDWWAQNTPDGLDLKFLKVISSMAAYTTHEINKAMSKIGFKGNIERLSRDLCWGLYKKA